MKSRDKHYVRRGVRPHRDDPYLLKSAYKEPTVCPKCDLIYHNKRWFWNDEMLADLKEKGTNEQTCPACRKIEDKYPMGILHMSGEFLKKHKGDILRLLTNEEKRAMEKNPLERIISTEQDENGEIVVQTTSEALVLRMGRVLTRAYTGEAEYKFSDTQKLVRVEWRRN